MKLVDLAMKDLLRSFRSAFLVVFMFVMPLLTVAIFWFAFGGPSEGDGDFELATVPVLVVNQDLAVAQTGDLVMGDILVSFLQSEELADLVEAELMVDPVEARRAVDEQQAAVAVIIPSDLTAAVSDHEATAEIEVYQDPSLSIGPAIVQGIVQQFVDGFAGARIATEVVGMQFAEYGAVLDDAAQQELAMAYATWSSEQGREGIDQAISAIDVQESAGDAEPAGGMSSVLGLIMAGMMVYYVFFTGASASQSILKEDEEGTLQRLFTTPTQQSTILAAKFVAVLVTLLVQTVVLVVLSDLVFGVRWGRPLPVALVIAGTVVLGSGFGVFLNSLIKHTKQSGIIYGVVLNVVGWIGIGRMFAASVPGTESFARVAGTVSLVSPHGWAMQGLEYAMAGGDAAKVLPTVAVMLVLGGVFSVIAVFRFRNRFT